MVQVAAAKPETKVEAETGGPNRTAPPVATTFVPRTGTPELELLMRKTGITDVYELTDPANGQNYGLAVISDLRASQYWRDRFSRIDQLIVHCEYQPEFEAYSPKI
jgi:hypothetical protein